MDLSVHIRPRYETNLQSITSTGLNRKADGARGILNSELHGDNVIYFELDFLSALSSGLACKPVSSVSNTLSRQIHALKTKDGLALLLYCLSCPYNAVLIWSFESS